MYECKMRFAESISGGPRIIYPYADDSARFQRIEIYLGNDHYILQR